MFEKNNQTTRSESRETKLLEKKKNVLTEDKTNGTDYYLALQISLCNPAYLITVWI